MAETVRLENVEIFRAGDYGDRGKFSEASLDQIVEDYKPEFIEAPVTIDHEQTGRAWGWVKAVARSGNLLTATMEVAEEFAAMVREGLFRKRSVELYRKMQATKRPYLKAISFLGAAAPMVKGLADIEFSEEAGEGIEIDFSEGETWNDPLVGLKVFADPFFKQTPSKADLGRIAAFFSPGGFKGQRASLTASEAAAAKATLRALYRSIGVEEKEIPFWAHEDDVQKFHVLYVRSLDDLTELRPDLVGQYKEEGLVMADETKERVDALEAQIAELSEAATKNDENITALTAERDELKDKLEAGEREAAKAEAQKVFAEQKANAKDLPEAALERLAEQFADAETAEGIEDAFTREVAYIAKLAEAGKVTGMGPSADLSTREGQRDAAIAKADKEGISYSQALVDVSRDAK